MFISQYQNFSSPQSWVNAYPSFLCIMRGKDFSWSLVVFFLVLKCRGPSILRKVSVSPGCWTHASSLNLPPLRPRPDDAPPPCSALGPLPFPDQCFSRCAPDTHSTCPGGLLSTWLPPVGLRRLRISQSQSLKGPEMTQSQLEPLSFPPGSDGDSVGNHLGTHLSRLLSPLLRLLRAMMHSHVCSRLSPPQSARAFLRPCPGPSQFSGV